MVYLKYFFRQIYFSGPWYFYLVKKEDSPKNHPNKELAEFLKPIPKSSLQNITVQQDNNGPSEKELVEFLNLIPKPYSTHVAKCSRNDISKHPKLKKMVDYYG